MIKILFICHGNICRSVAAQYIMQHLVQEAGMDDLFEIDSAAATTEEIGHPVYPPMRAVLEAHGIPIGTHRARRMTAADYDAFDMLIGMDHENLYDLNAEYGDMQKQTPHFYPGMPSGRITPTDPDAKISLLLDYAEGADGEISDPWYTRDFECAYREIEAGCRGLLEQLKRAGE